MIQNIKEGQAQIAIDLHKKISKEMPVFYNPVMKFNRDISVLLLNCVGKKNIQIGSPLAGSGVREIRFIKELNKGVIKSISVNDISDKAVNAIKKNLSLNKIKSKNVKVFNADANLFMLNSSGFDYIDIDPFGSPNAFLDSAIRRISREGILAVTATDTAALTGTYVNPCKRKYWAVPLRSYMMHEVGLRILIRKIQLVGAQYDKALIPIFSYYCEHYFRIFFRCEKSKEIVDSVIEQHGMFQDAGPIWLGKLWDEKLVELMERESKFNENNRVLRIIKEESKIHTVGFYDVTELASKYKLKVLPKLKDIVEKVKKKGFLCSETHFRENSIRSNISEKELVNMLNRKA
jgi:tRNA (guanine26-N2/guanine27-N2)-dimethyltransferase